MILAASLIAAVVAVVISELFGRGRVIYTRMLTLAVSYAAACVVADIIVKRYGAGLSDELTIPLSVVPLMASWLGFRIHLSNSVTLELVTLLEHGGPQSSDGILRAYDPKGHTATRLRILREAGYLEGDDDRVAATPKGRAVLWVIRVLCGSEGPRGVVAMLRRRASPG